MSGDLSFHDSARLSLNCTGSQVPPLPLESRKARPIPSHESHLEITILESNGATMVPDELRRQLKLLRPSSRSRFQLVWRYENACFAELKARGDFPYLSRPEEA